MATRAFNAVSRTSGLGQSGGVDRGVPRAAWVREHVTDLGAAAGVSELCWTALGNCPYPGMRRTPVHTPDDFSVNLISRTNMVKLGDSHAWAPKVVLGSAHFVTMVSGPQHALSNATDHPDGGDLPMQPARTSVIVEDAPGLIHALAAGYRWLVANGAQDQIPEVPGRLPGWATNIQFGPGRLNIGGLSPEAVELYSSATFMDTGITPEQMVLLYDIARSPVGIQDLTPVDPY